jgi:hypothetical protein
MVKTTKGPEQLEWESDRARRNEMMYRRLNERWEVWEELEAQQEGSKQPPSRRRLFPWRFRLERLD